MRRLKSQRLVLSETDQFVSCSEGDFTQMIQQRGNVWIQQTIKLQHKAKLMFSGQLHELNYSALMDTGGSVLSPRNNICQLCVCLSNHITHVHKEIRANCAVILKTGVNVSMDLTHAPAWCQRRPSWRSWTSGKMAGKVSRRWFCRLISIKQQTTDKSSFLTGMSKEFLIL